MFKSLARFFGNNSDHVVECRRCGSNRADGTTPCPNCGHEFVASYRL